MPRGKTRPKKDANVRHAVGDHRPPTPAEAIAIVARLIREGRMLSREEVVKAYREAVLMALAEFKQEREQKEHP